MPRFLTRPLEVEAVQWTGDNLAALNALVTPGHRSPFERRAGIEHLMLNTGTGAGMIILIGDWIIRRGAFLHRAHDENFRAAYTPVPPGADSITLPIVPPSPPAAVGHE